MDTLTDAFASLAEDKLARKSALNSLITSNLLSPTEIRDLRDQLNAIPLNRDICGELPVELLDIIVENLNLEDIMVASRVCKLWESRLLTFGRCVRLANVHLKHAWGDKWQHSLEAEECVSKSSKDEFMGWFGGAARSCVLRQKHHYQSTALYNYSITLSPGSRLFHSIVKDSLLYCNGRIAFALNTYRIIVQDLQSTEVNVYHTPERSPLQGVFLSDELLVARDLNGTKLHAWVLASSHGRPYTKIVPSLRFKHRAKGRRVEISIRDEGPRDSGTGLGLDTFRLYEWDVGSSMKEAPNSPTNIDEIAQNYPDPESYEDENWRVILRGDVLKVECYKKGIVLKDEVIERSMSNIP